MQFVAPALRSQFSKGAIKKALLKSDQRNVANKLAFNYVDLFKGCNSKTI